MLHLPRMFNLLSLWENFIACSILLCVGKFTAICLEIASGLDMIGMMELYVKLG